MNYTQAKDLCVVHMLVKLATLENNNIVIYHDNIVNLINHFVSLTEKQKILNTAKKLKLTYEKL